MTDQERTFGLLWIESNDTSAIQAERFEDRLGEDGIELAESISYTLDPARLQEQATSVIARFKAAGVTTLIFSGDPVAPATFTQEATAQGYSPEWVIGPSALVDINAFSRTYDQDQWSHAFGPSTLTVRTAPEDADVLLALRVVQRRAAPGGRHQRGALPEPVAVLLRAAGGRARPHPRDLPGRAVQPGADAQRHQLPVAVLRRPRPLALRGPQRRRRRHRGLVGPHRQRARRDPQGGHRHVALRRRWQALPAGGRGPRSESQLFDAEASVTTSTSRPRASGPRTTRPPEGRERGPGGVRRAPPAAG